MYNKESTQYPHIINMRSSFGVHDGRCNHKFATLSKQSINFESNIFKSSWVEPVPDAVFLLRICVSPRILVQMWILVFRSWVIGMFMPLLLGDITTKINAAYFGMSIASTGIEGIPRPYPYVEGTVETRYRSNSFRTHHIGSIIWWVMWSYLSHVRFSLVLLID